MKSILIISSQSFSLYNFRGELIKDLVNKGCKVICAAPDMSNEITQKLNDLGASTYKISGNRAKISLIEDIYFFIDIFKLILKIKPDGILLYFIKPILYGSIASWLLGVKKRIILIAGMGYVFTENSISVKYLMRPVIRLMYSLAIFFANKVIVLNDDDRKLISSMTFNKKKIKKIQGIGVDLEKFNSTTFLYNNTQYDFAYFGRLLKHKGINEIIASIKILKKEGLSPRVAFYGDVDENPSSFSLDNIYEWQAKGYIEYCGFTDDVVNEMKKCKILLLPSYREALPRTCQEAAAMGIPSIVSDVPGCREVIVNDETGLLVKVKDSSDLAAKMKIYLLDNELVKKHGKNAIKRAKDIYDVKKINNDMITFFESD